MIQFCNKMESICLYLYNKKWQNTMIEEYQEYISFISAELGLVAD